MVRIYKTINLNRFAQRDRCISGKLFSLIFVDFLHFFNIRSSLFVIRYFMEKSIKSKFIIDVYFQILEDMQSLVDMTSAGKSQIFLECWYLKWNIDAA